MSKRRNLKKEKQNAPPPTPVSSRKRKLRNDGRGERRWQRRQPARQTTAGAADDPQGRMFPSVGHPHLTTGDRSARSVLRALEKPGTRPLRLIRYEVVRLLTTLPPMARRVAAPGGSQFSPCAPDEQDHGGAAAGAIACG